LGSAVVETLREHKVQTIGIDLVNAATTDFVGCVSDVDFLRGAIKGGCKSIIHTAALHAPNLDFYYDDEYERVNVEGTKNILMISKNYEIKAVVFSSTTSLMITDDVKKREKDTTNVVVLKDSVDYGTPRNIYGTTKKIAEKMCMNTKEVNIAILRCSRFFVEDVFDTGAKPSERKVHKSNGNTKANEMLCGTRASLEDTVLAHLVALDRLKKEKEVSGENNKIGPLIISSISPLLSNSFDVSIASTSHLYKTLGWSLPVHISRIYDSSNSWKVLEISPQWSFKRLVREYEEGKHIEVILEGRY
jgi:nucleoside-diphosphate-sugar epimerase